MSIVPLVRPLPSGAQESVSSRVAREVFALATHLIRGIAHETRVRRDMNRLAEFDDYMLRDIGIARADIEGAVRRGHDGLSEHAGGISPTPSLTPLPPHPGRR